MANEYAHVFFNLALVLIVVIGIFFVLRKMKLIPFKGNKFVNVIQVVPIGPKEKIILIEANQSLLLLGATANHIETLHVFDSVENSEILSNDHVKGVSLNLNKLRELT